MLLVQGPLSEGIHYRLHSGDTLLLETQVCLSPWEPCRVSCTFLRPQIKGPGLMHSFKHSQSRAFLESGTVMGAKRPGSHPRRLSVHRKRGGLWSGEPGRGQAAHGSSSLGRSERSSQAPQEAQQAARL